MSTGSCSVALSRRISAVHRHVLLTHSITIDSFSQSKYKSRAPNPCAEQLERVLNAMEAADFNIRPMWKHVKELDKCMAENKYDPNKEKKSTMFYLNQYLDQQKHKTK
jgi:hypothetical protein